MPERLFIVSREPAREAVRLLGCSPEAAVLLVGRALYLAPEVFGERSIYAVEEEIEELGLEGKMHPLVKAVPAVEAIDLVLRRQVLNFG